MKKLFTTMAAIAIAVVAMNADEYLQWVDWDKIQHWAGDPDGENKVALVIDFQDGNSDCSYVWGYRWNGTKTGEDLIRAVASQSSVLVAMIQYTGTMGSTLNGLGISAYREELDYLHYDFDRAAVGGEVAFGFFSPNTAMGQETAPGWEAEDMCIEAIENARETGIIEHPLNAFIYGYPAYDYDYWQLEEGYRNCFEYRWMAGWYDGYWSYWHGPNDYEYMSYSGLGMSSTVLVDGSVQAWKYAIINPGETMSQGEELHEWLDYEIADYGEEMHEAAERTQPVDMEKITHWVGEGEKAATVLIRLDNETDLVYGYRWTGGWDDALTTVIKNIVNADSHLSMIESGNDFVLTYTYDSGEQTAARTGDTQREASANSFGFYVKRIIDNKFSKIPGSRWLNPNAVMIVAAETAEEVSVNSGSLNYDHTAPSSGITAVCEINPDNNENTQYYDLSGRRIDNPEPGQMILMRVGNNWKKVIVR